MLNRLGTVRFTSTTAIYPIQATFIGCRVYKTDGVKWPTSRLPQTQKANGKWNGRRVCRWGRGTSMATQCVCHLFGFCALL